MQVILLEEARSDIASLRRYIARDNSMAAKEQVRRILKHIRHLEENPFMGRLGRVTGTHELVIPGLPYIVAYWVRNGMIEILRVLHAAQVWPEQFQGAGCLKR